MMPESASALGRARRDGILVASVSVGAGHVRAAEALAESLRYADPARPLELIDILDLAPGWVRRFYREVFLRVAARSRTLAYRLYEATDGDSPDNVRWGHTAERLMIRKFRRLLGAGTWRDCLATHFLPFQVADPRRPPAQHLVVTDWALHRFWVQPHVRNFFVATEGMAATLRRRVPAARVHVTGIPVGARFALRHDRLELRRTLHLEPHSRVVLIMGGGWGLGVEEMVGAALGALVPDLVVLVVCGANRRALDVLSRHPSDRLRTSGFVDDVAGLVSAADLVISKPGGVTTSETLALGTPLLLTPGLPGHEDRNSRQLTESGAAQCVDVADLGRMIEQFFGDADLRARWVDASRRAGRPCAAAQIAAFFSHVGVGVALEETVRVT
jgi:processive 1,2-diacylglycerol beta-glucosyltransferase